MLAENETLFVEHKTSIGGEAFQVAKAMCSFANTLGGWVLIGVTNGAPNAGLPDGWEPVAGADLTDRVREALKENRVDPIPAFAATVRNVGEQPVGVVRVYESADAPHVIRNGQVFVRSVAEDANRQRVYRSGGVETQTVLIELVARGRRGERRAHEILEQFDGQFLLGALGFTRRQVGSGFYYELSPGTIALRAAPITGARLNDWAVSAQAKVALEHALGRLAAFGDDAVVESVVNISGLAARVSTDLTLASGAIQRNGRLTVAADCAGVVGASMLFGQWSPPVEPTRLTLNGLRDAFVMPLLQAVCDVLDDAELYGRSILRLKVRQLDQLAVIDDQGELRDVPADFRSEGRSRYRSRPMAPSCSRWPTAGGPTSAAPPATASCVEGPRGPPVR